MYIIYKKKRKIKELHVCAAYIKAQQWFAGAAAWPCNSLVKNVALREYMGTEGA